MYQNVVFCQLGGGKRKSTLLCKKVFSSSSVPLVLKLLLMKKIAQSRYCWRVITVSSHTILSNIIPSDTAPSSDSGTLVAQVKRVKEIEAIESDSFVQQTFRSSKEVKKVRLAFQVASI